MFELDFRAIILGGVISGILIILMLWGAWQLIDWLWIDDAIRSNKLIIPEIELTIKNNVVDTIYVYRLP